MGTIQLFGRRLVRRVRALILRGRVERELDDELRFHLEMETEYKVRHGLDPANARAAALREFGGVSRIKEDARDARGVRLWKICSLTSDTPRGRCAVVRASAWSPF